MFRAICRTLWILAIRPLPTMLAYTNTIDTTTMLATTYRAKLVLACIWASFCWILAPAGRTLASSKMTEPMSIAFQVHFEEPRAMRQLTHRPCEPMITDASCGRHLALAVTGAKAFLAADWFVKVRNGCVSHSLVRWLADDWLRFFNRCSAGTADLAGDVCGTSKLAGNLCSCSARATQIANAAVATASTTGCRKAHRCSNATTPTNNAATSTSTKLLTWREESLTTIDPHPTGAAQTLPVHA